MQNSFIAVVAITLGSTSVGQSQVPFYGDCPIYHGSPCYLPVRDCQAIDYHGRCSVPVNHGYAPPCFDCEGRDFQGRGEPPVGQCPYEMDPRWTSPCPSGLGTVPQNVSPVPGNVRPGQNSNGNPQWMPPVTGPAPAPPAQIPGQENAPLPPDEFVPPNAPVPLEGEPQPTEGNAQQSQI